MLTMMALGEVLDLSVDLVVFTVCKDVFAYTDELLEYGGNVVEECSQ